LELFVLDGILTIVGPCLRPSLFHEETAMLRTISLLLLCALALSLAPGCGDKTKTGEAEKTPPSDEPREEPMDISKLPKDLQPLATKIQPFKGFVSVEESEEDGQTVVKHVLDLSNTQDTDRLLAEAKPFSSITHVYLINSSVTNEGLRHLSEMKNVVYLNLDASPGHGGMQLSDAGLKHLEKSSVKRLTLLGNHSFSSAALDALKEAKGGGDSILITKPN
jgi:hypothetical protein